MRFSLPFLEELTLPADAGPGDTRIFIDGPNATINFYKNGVFFGTLTTVGGVPGFFIFGSDGSQVALQTVIATGETQIENLGSGTETFRIANGRIETDQIQAAVGPVGAITGKLEIFDDNGVSQGFLPVYATIT